MTISRTARGTAFDKSAALTLTIPNVTIVPPAMLHTAVGFDAGVGAPSSVVWGSQTLLDRQAASGGGVVCRQYGRHIGGTEERTHDVVYTWDTTAPTAKAAFASQYAGAFRPDASAGNTQLATGAPTSGNVTTRYRGELFVGAMVSEGPPADTPGTPSSSYSAGQRIGTVGAPPVSNIVIREIFFIQADTDATVTTAAAVTGATARDWASTIVTYRQDDPDEVIDEESLLLALEDLQEAHRALTDQGFTVTLTEDAVSLALTDIAGLYYDIVQD